MRHVGGISSLIVLTVAAYWGVGGFDFVDFDDDVYLLDNPRVAEGLSGEAVAWAFTTGHHSNWHPVTWVSYLAEIEVFGLDAGVMHVTNLLLHVLVCVLLYSFFWRTTGAFGASLFVAAVFAVHPLHVEAVAWISERKELLAAVFGLGALHAYVSYTRDGARLYYGLSLLAFALGLMCKAMWVTLPLLLILADYWPLRRARPWRELVVDKVPFFAIGLAAGVATILAQGGGESVQSLDTIPLAQRVGNAVLSYGVYLWNTVWPTGLAIFYPHPRGTLSWAMVAASLGVLIAISVTMWRWRWTHPSLVLGWGWFLVSLLPVIGVLQVGGQAYADRYTYMPHIGLFGGFVFALPRFDSLRKRQVIALTAGGVVAACAVMTFAQVRHWRDTETLFTRAIAVTQENVLAHAVLGRHYADGGAYALAESHARAAVGINPAYGDGWRELALALQEQGMPREAADAADRLLALEPENVTGWYTHARAMASLGEEGAAERSFLQALAIEPGNAVVRTAYGNVLARAALDGNDAKLEAAAAQYLGAIESDPDYGLAHLNLGRIRELQGRREEAKRHHDAANALLK